MARTIRFFVDGPIARDDVEELCARVCSLLDASRPTVALCDVRTVAPDVVTVEALARLQLAARRHGCRVRLVHASDALRDLVAFMGLREVLPCSSSRRDA